MRGERERERGRGESKRGQHARAGEDNRIGVSRFSCFALQCQEFPLVYTSNWANLAEFQLSESRSVIRDGSETRLLHGALTFSRYRVLMRDCSYDIMISSNLDA